MGDLLLAQAACVGNRLPNACHVVLPGMPPGHNVGISVRGKKGALLTIPDFGDTHTARCMVRAFNMGRGIKAYHEHAMLVGSLLGWDRPQANPRFLMRHDKRFAEVESNATGFSFHGATANCVPACRT
jgi:hypothetical protein